MAGAEVGQPPGEPGGVAGQQPGIATLKYSDGSEYKGTLKHGLPHGIGTCVWVDGNRYDGEWRNGVMHGFGTYLWTSGQRYDGEWKDGKRDGVGVKMYGDGSTFHGIWREGKKHGVGVFKPATKDREKDHRTRMTPKTNIGRPTVSPADGDSVSNLRVDESSQPSDAKLVRHDSDTRESENRVVGGHAPEWEATSSNAAAEVDWDNERTQDRGREKDKDSRERDKERDKERKVVFIRAFEDGVLRREDKLNSEDAKMIFGQPPLSEDKGRGNKAKKKVKRALGLGKKLQQKHGQLLYKGMPGYNLMLRLQQGIRYSVGRGSYSKSTGGDAVLPPQNINSIGGNAGPVPLSHKLNPADFTEKVKVFFPSNGSKETPAHPAGDFKWKDYSPRVFRNLRNMYGITDADYMLSLGGSTALWQLNSPGKSGCMFFLSDDERFLVKTMRKTEIRTLITMLPEYYKYMEREPRNLVIRFFGVHGVKQVHGRTVRFVVMHNMFNTDLQIHKKFDLKGSTDGRTTGPKVDSTDPKTIFKDLDLDLQFVLDLSSHTAVMRQISSDADFLRRVDVMDYSLLLGIHFISRMRVALEHDDAVTEQQQQPQQAPQQQVQQQLTVAAAAEAAAEAGRQVGEAIAGGSPSPSGASVGAAGAGGGSSHQPVPLLSMSSHESTDGEEPTGQRVSPSRVLSVAQPHSPGAFGGARTTFGIGEDPDGEHVRNFDLFSDRPDLNKQLLLIEERMRGLGFTEQRMQDILSLVRLRILGDKMKKRSKKAYKVYDGPSTVLMALASRRHGPDSLPRLEETEEQPGSDDEADEGPLTKQPPYFGYQMRALAVHTRADLPPEEVILCFGIIDILQEWNTRKVLERTVKSFTHDSFAISVAPPKLYSVRFADFLTKTVFLDPASAAARGLRLQTIEEEGESDYRR